MQFGVLGPADAFTDGRHRLVGNMWATDPDGFGTSEFNGTIEVPVIDWEPTTKANGPLAQITVTPGIAPMFQSTTRSFKVEMTVANTNRPAAATGDSRVGISPPRCGAE